MSLRINLNTAALTAHRLLAGSDSELGKTIERLSSGYRINSAADDPAGLVISEKLRAQVTGLGQAIKNAGDAVNMVKTAEAALNEVSRLVRSMRDLAVHAANTGGNDAAALTADQQQVTNAIQSINKIAEETQFGNKKLLDGSAGMRALVVGTNIEAGDFSYSTTLNEGDLVDITVTQVAQQATVETDTDISGGIGEDGFFYINGVRVDYTSADTEVTLTQKVNAVQNATGVYGVADTVNHTVEFYSEEYGSDARVDLSGLAAAVNSATTLTDTGQDVQATVQVAGTDMSDASWQNGSGTVLKDAQGNSINLTTAAATSAAAYNDQFLISKGSLIFQVGAYAGQTRELSLPSVRCEELGTTAVSGESLATIDLVTDPQNAILILDEAIRNISTIRGALGATQKNVFESSITSLTIAKENIAASESSIRDTDMAEEVVNLTRTQILQSAGVAMLAQANTAPQSLLKLLQ